MDNRTRFDEGLNRRGVQTAWFALFLLVALGGIAIYQLLR